MKIDLISGFFGAGKTTFLNKYLPILGEGVVLIENEFGDIGLDASLIEYNLKVKEINSGCICCSLQDDFKMALQEIFKNYQPHKVVIEPSGISKLSQIVSVCQQLDFNVEIDHKIVIVEAVSFLENIEDFGNFFVDQIQLADVIFLNRYEVMSDDNLSKVIDKISRINPNAKILLADYRNLTNEELLNLITDNSIGFNEKCILQQEHQSHSEHDYDDLESFGIISKKAYTKAEIEAIILALKKSEFGNVVRAKGIVVSTDKNKWHFDYTKQSFKIELLNDVNLNQIEMKLIFIGHDLNKEAIKKIEEVQ